VACWKQNDVIMQD